MKQYTILFFGYFLIFNFQSLGGEIHIDHRGLRSVNNWTRYANVRLVSEKIVFAYGEDIPIKINIQNQGYQDIRVYPSQGANKSFQFILTDNKGQELPQNFQASSWNKRERDFSFQNTKGKNIKEILLAPQESFIKTLYLNDFYNLEAGKSYRLWLYFYPSLENFFVRSENLLHIKIRKKNAKTKKLFVNEKKLSLSPKETVFLFLSAEKERNCSHILKYLDISKYIVAYNNFAYRYSQSSLNERMNVAKDFEDFLCYRNPNKLLSFQMGEAESERDKEGRTVPYPRYFVHAKATHQKGSYQAKYKYKYTLEAVRNTGFWKIVYVEAEFIR